MIALPTLLAVAASFWGQTPACGTPTVGYEVMPGALGGLAHLEECRIGVRSNNEDNSLTPNPSAYWKGYDDQECVVVIHEYGHFLFGRNYFAATNPSDPAHSPDPYNIMSSTSGLSKLTASQVAPICAQFAPPEPITGAHENIRPAPKHRKHKRRKVKRRVRR